MKTPTHALLGYAVAHAMGWTSTKRYCAIVGAVMPDIPVIMAGIVSAVLTNAQNGAFAFAHFKTQMDLLYFSDPVLRVSHNFLHAPLNLALLAALAFVFLDARRRSPVLAFLAGAASHALLDIVSHVDDGPLLFWPFDAVTRLTGPFSHWQAGRGGLIVTVAECCLFLVGLIILSTKPFLPTRKRKSLCWPTL